MASKDLKRKFERKAHKKIIADDGLREIYLSRTSNILTPKLFKRKCIYYLIISKHYINFNLYLVAFIILLFQHKFQMYQKYHVYQS